MEIEGVKINFVLLDFCSLKIKSFNLKPESSCILKVLHKKLFFQFVNTKKKTSFIDFIKFIEYKFRLIVLQFIFIYYMLHVILMGKLKFHQNQLSSFTSKHNIYNGTFILNFAFKISSSIEFSRTRYLKT